MKNYLEIKIFSGTDSYKQYTSDESLIDPVLATCRSDRFTAVQSKNLGQNYGQISVLEQKLSLLDLKE